MLPRGTHDFAKFIKPSELTRWCKQSGLEPDELIGMTYNPLTRHYALDRDTDVNYLVRATRGV
jgi:2-polyprenyl-6-hydroxyphenyl methylase/3-demethylubiquinone-9 3-methyltransferase